MPEHQNAPNIPDVDLEQAPLIDLADQIADNAAKTLVTRVFYQYENFRAQNHDKRWLTSDELYTGWLPLKVWEGSTTPRSSLGWKLVFNQIEAALPSIISAVFNNGDPDWFTVEPDGDTSPEEAEAMQSAMQYVMDHNKGKVFSTVRREIELAVKNVLHYGNGGVLVSWDDSEQRPFIEWVDIRDIYVDPGCPTASIDECRSVIHRKLMTVTELKQFAEDSRYKIPNDAILYTLSSSTPNVFSDQMKRTQEAYRNVSWQPGVSDWSPNPADRSIEVLIYYSKDRVIWLLNRTWVMFNEVNEFGFIPFCFAPCYIVPNRFYAMSMGDVNEQLQRYIEALLNARLDLLSLELNPPRAAKRSTYLTPNQMRWRPGAIYMAEDPKDWALLANNNSSIPNVFQEIQFFEIGAEKATGINSASQGSIRPGNANRTATGIRAQTSGASGRLMYLVSNIEQYLIVPMLSKLALIMKQRIRPDVAYPVVKRGEKQYVQGDVFQRDFIFRMEAASQMLSRERLLSALPFLAQYFLAAPFIQSLNQLGKTVDFEVFAKLVQEAVGTGKKYPLIREMSQQEQQALQQPPAQAMMEMQQAQQELQTRLQMGQMKAQSEIQKTLIMKQPDPSQNQADMLKARMDMAKAQQEMEMSRSESENKLRVEQILAQIKLQTEREKMAMDREKQQHDLSLKHAEGQINLQGLLQKAQLEYQKAIQQQQNDQVSSELEQEKTRSQHELNMQQMFEMAAAKRSEARKAKKASKTEKAKPPSAGKLG